jgi:hypothetical protein
VRRVGARPDVVPLGPRPPGAAGCGGWPWWPVTACSARRHGVAVALAAVCASASTGCGGQRALGARNPRSCSATPATICGLALPCKGVAVRNSHDLYGAMVQGLEEAQPQVLSNDRVSGCTTCAEPEAFFSSVQADPKAARQVLPHIYLSLIEAAREAFRGAPPASAEAAWRGAFGEVGRWSAARLARAREARSEIPCMLPTAYCASRPEFGEAFVRFAEKVLFQEPGDQDPGFVKESTVKLALTLGPPEALPVVLRFIRSGARARARWKALRDLCGIVRLREVRETFQWVARSDPEPDMRDRAASCLRAP